MKIKWSLLAVLSLALLTNSPLYAETYFLESTGGQDSAPYPMDPYHGTMPMSEISPGIFLISDVSEDSESLESSGSMTTSSLDPGEGGGESSSESSSSPNIRNYAKFGGQIFSLLNTNDLVVTDTNLYNACAAFPADTNSFPTLQIRPYGADAVIIKANHFDYSSETTRDFALLVCDDIAKPTWKTIDFFGASDSQDGWLVQGTVPNWKVTDAMFMIVTNITHAYSTFFQAIPYGGPQVALTGPAAYETVSNTITLNAAISDLSGVTNDQFTVTVDGLAARYSLITNNTVSLETKYNVNGFCTVYMDIANKASVYEPTNSPADVKLFFKNSGSLPLDFENDTFLAFASDNASIDIGTNYFVFTIDKAQDIDATITDPSNGHVVAHYAGYVPYATEIWLSWNFTESDHVTPYTNDTYVVSFTAFDPTTLVFTNKIIKNGVRTAGGNILTYELEDPDVSAGPFLNHEANFYIGTLSEGLYSAIYDTDFLSIPQYTVGMVGTNRDNPTLFTPIVLNHDTQNTWGVSVCNCLTNRNFSDFGYYMGHGNGTELGGGPSGSSFVMTYMRSMDLTSCVQQGSGNWRMRKVAVWACYSDSPYATTANGTLPSWADAFGIQSTSKQRSGWMMKNVGLFFGGELPQAGFSSTSGGTSVEVAAQFDLLWVLGPDAYPGGCDPTYAFSWAYSQMRGMSPEVDKGFPAWIGFGYLPYTGIYDAELIVNNVSHIKR